MKKWLPLIALVGCTQPTPQEAPPPPEAAASKPAPPKTTAPQPASAQGATTAPAARTTTGPRIVAAEGDVRVDGKPGAAGAPITPTSTIETGDKAWAHITIVPHSVIAVRPNTKFKLGKSPRKEWSVHLLLGAIWSFLPHGASYEVTTDNAVAGVRGTTLYVGAPENGKTGVCACDGDVELTVGKKKKRVRSKHEHIGTLIAGSESKAKMVPQKKIKPPPGHDDVEGARLEKLRDSLDK